MTVHDLTVATEHQAVTVEEFEQFSDAPENTDRRFELIHGEIVEKVPTEEHSIVSGNFHAYIWNFNKLHKLGGRVGVEPRHKMPNDEHNARIPYVALTSAARLLPLTKEGSVPQIPDLCVEVQSPGDSPHQMREKSYYYLKNGTKIVWLAYPALKRVEVCTLNAEGAMQIVTINENGTLDGGEVLPGFTLAINDVFDVA